MCVLGWSQLNTNNVNYFHLWVGNMKKIFCWKARFDVNVFYLLKKFSSALENETQTTTKTDKTFSPINKIMRNEQQQNQKTIGHRKWKSENTTGFSHSLINLVETISNNYFKRKITLFSLTVFCLFWYCYFDLHVVAWFRSPFRFCCFDLHVLAWTDSSFWY